MSTLLKPLEDGILQANTYDDLAIQVKNSIENNMFNHIYFPLNQKMISLNLNSNVYKYIKILVWVTSFPQYEENALNLLRELSNYIIKDINSNISIISDYALFIVAICANNKLFINHLNYENKCKIIQYLENIYTRDINSLSFHDNEDRVNRLNHLFVNILTYLINGKSLDEIKYLEKDTLTDFLPQILDKYIYPIFYNLSNLIENRSQIDILTDLNRIDWEKKLYYEINQSVSRFINRFSTSEKPLYSDDLNYLFKSFITIFSNFLKDFKPDISISDYKILETAQVGKLARDILYELQMSYDMIDNSKLIGILMMDAFRITTNNFVSNNRSKWVISFLLEGYYDGNKYEDFFMQGPVYEGIKASLNEDPSFKLLVEDINLNRYSKELDALYKEYILSIHNPFLVELPRLENNNTTNSFLPATEAVKNKKMKLDENDSENTNDEEDENNEEDDEEYNGPEIDAKQSTKGYKKNSKKLDDAENKIYKAYKTYKDNESKVDSQLTKMLNSAKRAFSQDKTEEIIEGKRFTPIGLLKRILVTSAIFSYSKIAGFAYLLVKHTLSKKRTQKQQKEILLQIETEIKLLEEKIEDARSDGNRKAKYALMRTKAELERARDKIKFGLSATKQDMQTAKSYISKEE